MVTDILPSDGNSLVSWQQLACERVSEDEMGPIRASLIVYLLKGWPSSCLDNLDLTQVHGIILLICMSNLDLKRINFY